MTRIGYMGIPFSNSEEMSQIFAREMGFDDAEHVPLVTSKDVVDALCNGKVDYGVVAVRNSTAGPVLETQRSLEGKDVKTVSRAVKSFVSAGRLGICSGKKEHSGSITGSCPGRDRSGNDRISGQRRNSCQTSGSNPKVCGKN